MAALKEKFAERMALRIVRAKTKNATQKEQITTVMDDKDMMDALLEECAYQAQPSGGPKQITIGEVFKWMIANPELVMQLVTLLISAFSKTP